MQASLKWFARYWLPVGLYAALIIFLSSRPLSGLPPFHIWDKLLHFIEYSVLGLLLCRLLLRDLKMSGMQLWLILLGVTALFACGDEFLQSLIPTRQASAYDWIADMLGGVCGALTYLFLRRIGDRIHLTNICEALCRIGKTPSPKS